MKALEAAKMTIRAKIGEVCSLCLCTYYVLSLNIQNDFKIM